MMNSSSQAPRIESSRLAVEFVRSGDRFRHTIFIRSTAAGGGVWKPLFASHEGNVAPRTKAGATLADRSSDWPWSAVLQELHIEPRAGGPIALLVGRAGKSHWSASFEFDASGAFVADIACRVHQPPQWLGMTYQPRMAISCDAPDGPISLASVHLRPSYRFTSPEFDGLACVDSSAADDAVVDALAPLAANIEVLRSDINCVDALTMQPSGLPAADARLPCTVRWRYRIQVAESC